MECFHELPATVYRASFVFPFQEDFSTPDTDGTLQEDFTTLDMDGRLQDFFASAVPKESLRDESKRMVMGLDSEKLPLLNPSGMDTSIFDDLAISVIKNLAG